jgi:hypothetical protein
MYVDSILFIMIRFLSKVVHITFSLFGIQGSNLKSVCPLWLKKHIGQQATKPRAYQHHTPQIRTATHWVIMQHIG